MNNPIPPDHRDDKPLVNETGGRPNDPVGTATGETIDTSEVIKFTAMAEAWWDPSGKLRPLHLINPVRLDYIIGEICEHFGRSRRASHPLKDLTILDVGCGGGLVCEPLARLGAEVTGVDAAAANIPVARIHAEKSNLDIVYINATVEDLVNQGHKFDIVLGLEIIEHVNQQELFIGALGNVMRPAGLLILSTFNKTLKSFALGILAAEYILSWLPRGTHDWRRFVAPSLMEKWVEESTGLFMTKNSGISYNPLTDSWKLTRDLSCNYLMTFKAQDHAS